MSAMEDIEPYKRRRSRFGNAWIPLLCFDFHGSTPTFQRWYSLAAENLLSDNFGALMIITITPSLPANVLNSICDIFLFVPDQVNTTSIGF